MLGPKARNIIAVFLIMLFSALLLSGCSLEDVSDTIGSCCGATALPIGAMVLVVANRWGKES